MANHDSFIRSAAQATFSAYRRLPIRWRLAGGSALLTLVILMGFALVVGTLTTHQIRRDFDARVDQAADALATSGITFDPTTQKCSPNDIQAFGRLDRAKVRLYTYSGDLLCPPPSQNAPDFGPPRLHPIETAGYRVVTREVRFPAGGSGFLQYARPLADTEQTIDRVRVFLLLGVLGGALLALLAGLEVARRAMRPVAQLTRAAAEIERTRDPSLRVPHPVADDEVAKLAHTLDRMLGALDAAQAETEATLARQRDFVADASHELRTPLTSILAHLELLSLELHGEQGDAARSATRSAQRMRRLVDDLLLLARADAGRRTAHAPTDLGAVLVGAAAELEPIAGAGHELVVDAQEGVIVDGARDDLHRLALNLVGNAVRHTPEGTTIDAAVTADGDRARLVVADDGPGIPPAIVAHVFERFVRAGGDGAGSSGLGLAIVAAVAEAHGGSARLEPSERGARFVVELPLAAGATLAAQRSEPGHVVQR